jgi:hypothetical protein
MILKFSNKKIELLDSEYMYLYSYLVKFSLKYKVDRQLWTSKGIFYISDENRDYFIKMLENIIEELLDDFYKVPTPQQRSKHPGYFRNVIYQDKKYILNYIKDIVGLIVYRLIYIITQIESNE